ncbi:hypothetical protein V8F06_014337 [Rhypophila decipiens]
MAPLAGDKPTTSLPMDVEGACNESQALTPAACSGSDHVSILKDEENCSEKLKYTKDIHYKTENGQGEVFFTPKPPAKQMTFALEIRRLKGPSDKPRNLTTRANIRNIIARHSTD